MDDNSLAPAPATTTGPDYSIGGKFDLAVEMPIAEVAAKLGMDNGDIFSRVELRTLPAPKWRTVPHPIPGRSSRQVAYWPRATIQRHIDSSNLSAEKREQAKRAEAEARRRKPIPGVGSLPGALRDTVKQQAATINTQQQAVAAHETRIAALEQENAALRQRNVLLESRE